MAVRRFSRGGSRGGRKIDNKTWSNMVPAAAVALTTTQGVIGSVTNTEGSGLDFTLMRSRGQLLVTGAPNAAGDAEIVGLGLIVVSAAALAVGGSSVPGPILDQGADWLWHHYVPMNAEGATAESVSGYGFIGWQVIVDAKAMRRVPPDHAVALIGELDQGSFANVQVTGGIRFLLGT